MTTAMHLTPVDIASIKSLEYGLEDRPTTRKLHYLVPEWVEPESDWLKSLMPIPNYQTSLNKTKRVILSYRQQALALVLLEVANNQCKTT